MEEDQRKNRRTFGSETRSFGGWSQESLFSYQQHHYLLQLQNSYAFGFGYANHLQFFPALLPLPPISNQLFPQNQRFEPRTTHFRKHSRKQSTPSDSSQIQDFSVSEEACKPRQQPVRKAVDARTKVLAVARRPDCGGVEGKVITLLANHFLVKFDPTQKIFHYDVEFSPHPSKEVARMIKKKLVLENSKAFSGCLPVYDGRRTIYSPVEFQNERFELYIKLPLTEEIGENLSEKHSSKDKIFKVNMKLVSKFDGEAISSYLNRDEDCSSCPLPQEYIHALDVVLRESSSEKCLSAGRSFYSSLMGGAKEIGGGAVALRGFFQSIRPTQQGLALNVDFSVTAFHESIGVIPYLQKRLEFMQDISQKPAKILSFEEKKQVEDVLKSMRVFVCHRETLQRYRVYGLTDEIAESIWFPDRDGKNLKLVKYFKDHYDYDIKFRFLPCLRISRRKPCYIPMELCVVCEGQKFLGKLSDEQTVKMLKMGCQKPRERKAIIDGFMEGGLGPTSGDQANEFKLHVSRQMTQLTGRILQPPKLKLGNGGNVRNLTPSRHDRQWNLLDSHVFEGIRIERWAILSFGGTPDQRFSITKFMNLLSDKCEQLGIFLNKETVISPVFEPIHILGNPKLLESKLKKIHRNNLQLLICVMERKHKGYADLKRIAETTIGIVSQCCLYSNLGNPNSQFLANLALKINAKVGGCTVALYNSLPSQIPRLFRLDEPVIFLGADVTHPHPLDDSSPSIAAVVGSVNWPAANKYVSRMKSQTHRQEIIEDLTTMVAEILDDFYQEISKLPERIIFFRDGVSETQFQKVLQQELQSIRDSFHKFPGYNPPITFAVVQKRHHTRFFPTEISPHCNVPPGTVIDSVITHPKEFDFYLCSHWGIKGTSRPIHYHILWDENEFTSDEVQKLVYNLCYTSARCTKPISLVPPAYYAHLAAYRGRLYLDRCDIRSPVTVPSSPQITPLPKLNENIKKLMFYC